MKSTKKLVVFVLIILAITVAQFADPQTAFASRLCGGVTSTIYYVDINAPVGGTHDGCSWATAYFNLQDALMNGTLQSGDEIRVANGTYYPDLGTGQTNNARGSTFTLVAGVSVYGGYAGYGAANPDLRNTDPATNGTALNGDIDGTPADNTNNAYHVVTGVTITAGTELSGFTIRGGNADGVGDTYGGGIYANASHLRVANVIITDNRASSSGGGVAAFGISNMTFSNATISVNTSQSDGGGIYIQTGQTLRANYSTPIFSDITFDSNIAARGGGLYLQNSNAKLNRIIFTQNRATGGAGGGLNIQTINATDEYSIPELTDITFSRNIATGGGGMFLGNSNAIVQRVTFSNNEANRRGGGTLIENSSPKLTNVTFSGNISYENTGAAPRGGGAIILDGGNPTITNATFSGNDSRTVGGDAIRAANNSNPVIYNSIFWADIDDEITTDATGSVTIYDSRVTGGCPAGTTCPSNVTNADPVLGSLNNYGGFTQTIPIGVTGSAVDQGNNATCASTNEDQRGVARPLDGDGNGSAICDIGAYELQSRATTTTTITLDDPDPSAFGQAVTVNFTVTSASGTPTGNVTVTDSASAASCTGTVAAGACSITLTTVGARTLTATYAGDSNFAGSTSAGVAHTVNQASTTTTITADTLDPSVVGQAVTVNFTVAVVAPGSGTPTGNVTVSDGVDSCTGTVAAGTCNITLTTVGSRTLTATYAGDTNFSGSSDTETHTVNQASTTTTITADTPDSSVVGQTVAVTYTVTSADGTPTGNVTVSDGVNSCTATVAAGTCNIILTTVGSRTLTATYAGDTNFATSSDTEPHTVNQASTTTTIYTDTPDPSVVGQPVTITFTVVVVTPGNGTPTGNVTVSDGVNSCTGTVASGSCSITLTTVGTRTLTATYAGDTNFAGSTSTGAGHAVNQASTTTTITADTLDPSVVGQAVTVNFTVAVVAPGSGTPTGNVTVTDSASAASCTGTVAAGTCNITLGTAGARTLTATYAGDTNFSGSNDTEAHVVVANATTTTITADTPDPSAPSQAVTVNFTVTSASGTPTGNVTVTDSASAVTCTGTVAAGTCNITLTTVGARTLTATYAGDTNFAGSSDTEPHTVNQAPAITSANNITFTVGAAGTFTVTTSGYPTPALSHTAGALPSGVTFVDNGDGTASLTGTPAAGTANTYTLTFVANNGVNPNANQTFTLTVNTAPAITSANNATFSIGSLGSFTITTSGSPTVSTITIGGDALPANVIFTDLGNGTATLSGIPATGTDGTYNLTFTASNGVGTNATQNFTLTVELSQPPKIMFNGVGSVPDSGDGYIAEAEIVTVGVTKLLVTFSQNVRNVGSDDLDSVTNIENYILVRDNGDGIQTTACGQAGGVIGGDEAIQIDSISYSNGGGSGPFVATLNLNSGTALLEGAYRLIVCGQTSIVNTFGVALAGDGVNSGTDFRRNFVIALAPTSETVAEAKALPKTGFPMGVVTDLPAQPAEKAYSAYGELWLEIPKLGVKMSIVGVPHSEGTWDVTWLGSDAGYLQGTAFPTWAGNTVITGHVWDAYNNPGPFAKIKSLVYGDQVKIHAFGQVYTYAVQDSQLVSPSNTRSVLKHEELDWVTLLTCEDYKVLFQKYTYRRAVRAVLVSVSQEK